MVDDFVKAYQELRQRPDWPASKAFVVTPSDTADLIFNGKQVITRALYIGGVGNIEVSMQGDPIDGEDGDNRVLFSAVPAGFILPIRVTKVWGTGTTTATLIVAMW